jgi:hypothetical protein
MRFLGPLVVVLGALVCAAPTCDTHDGAIGSGSGSSAWARMPSSSSEATPAAGSATPHQDVVHAMESVTGASLEPAKPKPAKPRPTRTHESGGNGGRSSSSTSKPSPPPELPLPENGRKLGQKCDDDEECASNLCEFEVCAKHTNDKLTKGEKCDYSSQCVSDHCYEDECQ